MRSTTLTAAATACALLATPAAALGAKPASENASRKAAAAQSPRVVSSPASQQPRPRHIRLIYTGGAFSPVSVVFTSTSDIARIDATGEEGPHLDAGVGVASNPSIHVSSYGRCYQAYASSYVVKQLHIGHRYPVTIAIGHGSAQRRFTRKITLRRVSLKGTLRHLGCAASKSATRGLVGERKHVQVKQLLVYHDPAKSYIGSLQTGQSFTVTKLSPTKTYAYGFAYGHINKHVWVHTSKLLASAVPQPATPTLRAHSIFTGGAATFHVGAIVEVDATHRSIAKLCISPAPIDRPACSASKVFAPSAVGTTTLTATLADGGSAKLPLHVTAAATHLGGPVAVPGLTTCVPTKLYGNYDASHHKLVDDRGTVAAGARVALYNRIGDGRLAWVYATNANGLAKVSCVK